MLCCPITHQAKGYPFEVDIRGDSHVSGVVLSDQVKCLDWQARGIRKKGVASRAELEETLEKLKTLLEGRQISQWPFPFNNSLFPVSF
jgi:mRNA interferase MazF